MRTSTRTSSCAGVVALSLVVLGLTGCGQALTVRLERVKSVEREDLPAQLLAAGVLDETQAVESIVALAHSAGTLTTRVKEHAKKGSPTETQATEDETYFAERANASFWQGKSLQSLVDGFAELRTRVAPYLDDRFLARDDAARTAAATTTKDLKIASQKLSAALIYGGYSSNTIFILAPGSNALAELRAPAQQKALRYELVQEPISLMLTGDSTAVVVQENPGYYTTRYIYADPRQVIRNTLVIVNRILRIAASYVPLIGGLAEAVPSGGSGAAAATAATTPTPRPATEVAAQLDEQEQQVRKLLDLQENRDLLQRLQGNPGQALSDADQAKLRQLVQSVSAALGTPVATPAATKPTTDSGTGTTLKPIAEAAGSGQPLTPNSPAGSD